jgi:Protein of unknown function (DUF4232)
MNGARHARALAIGLTALLSVAACTSSSGPAGGRPKLAFTPASTSAVVAPTPAPTTAAATVSSTPAPPKTTSGSATPATTTAAPKPPPTTAAPRSTCSSLQIIAIRGSAVGGQEIAALEFTNTGSTSCRLVGYPTVTLLRAGKTIGTPSQPSSTALSARTLAPGDVAESLLHDFTNCQAPLSDTIRVVAPGSSHTATRPAQLRACTVRVDKLGPPD